MLAHVSVLEADVRKTEAELEEYSGMDPEKFCNMGVPFGAAIRLCCLNHR